MKRLLFVFFVFTILQSPLQASQADEYVFPIDSRHHVQANVDVLNTQANTLANTIHTGLVAQNKCVTYYIMERLHEIATRMVADLDNVFAPYPHLVTFNQQIPFPAHFRNLGIEATVNTTPGQPYIFVFSLPDQPTSCFPTIRCITVNPNDICNLPSNELDALVQHEVAHLKEHLSLNMRLLITMKILSTFQNDELRGRVLGFSRFMEHRADTHACLMGPAIARGTCDLHIRSMRHLPQIPDTTHPMNSIRYFQALVTFLLFDKEQAFHTALVLRSRTLTAGNSSSDQQEVE